MDHIPQYLTMPHWPKLLFDNRPGTPLSRTQDLLAKLGNPEKSLPPVVHVAGTNGKGSTITFLRAMLESAGYKVHAYTSPHLHRFNERIVLAGREIRDDELFLAIEETRIAAGDASYSFFEGTTAAALLAFSRTPADIVLLETGAGGRFDPTNVINKPALTIITTISHDHTDILGKTLGDIAWHKAGILREGVPCVLSFEPDEVLTVLSDEAEKIGAIAYRYGSHWAVQKTSGGMRYITAEGEVELPPPVLLGPHQYVNAGNAIAAATLLEEFDISQHDIEQGLRNASWPGRLERIISGPRFAMLPEGWELWVDGGHNMAAGHMLASFIDEVWQDKPTYIIFGTTQGKNVESLLAPLLEKVAGVYATPVISEPKSYAAETIAQMVPANICANVEDAIAQILRHAVAPARILVFGSLYLRVLVA
jgi:dihydrofolate synthase/folylpolyglutamate synthase